MTDQSTETHEGIARGLALGRTNEEALLQKQIEFLEQQGRLQRLDEELKGQQKSIQVAELDNLLDENRDQQITYFRERLRLVFDSVLAITALMLAGLLFQLVYSAWHSKNVVVSAFDAPPALEAQGQTGKVIASGLLDRLQEIQSQTRSSQSRRTVQDAWSGDINVEIPEARVSIGEIQRYLRQWLGSDVQIGGSVVQTAKGIALTVRGSNVAAKTFEAESEALPSLLVQAAEYIFGQSETYLFAGYLQDHGRNQESVELVQAAFGAAAPSDKPLLLNAWANGLIGQSKFDEALRKYREAVRLQPDLWTAYSNIMFAQARLAQEEAVVSTGLQVEQAARRGRWFAKNVRDILFMPLDVLRWDLPAAHRALLADMATSDGHGTSTTEAAPTDAQLQAQMHDPQAAQLTLKTSPGAGKDPFVITQTDFVNALIALDHGEFEEALQHLQTMDTALSGSVDLASNFIAPACWLALAEAHSPQIAAAKVDADLARGGRFVDCYRFRADISDLRGDWALAQTQYAEAVALAPSIPSSYYSWGAALLRHGDVPGAIEKFSAANTRGPHWADPLKGWGDALAAKKDFIGAAQRHEEAAQYAPNWGQLHLHWAQALVQLGNPVQAKAQYQKALDSGLSAADRTIAEADLAKL